jgi:hypothetical protein
MNDIPQWRKSSYSGGHGGNCVEVTTTEHGVAVRDSMNPDGPPVYLTAAQWASLCKAVLAAPRERRVLTTPCGSGPSSVCQGMPK